MGDKISEDSAKKLLEKDTPNTENFHKVVTGKDEGQKKRADQVIEDSKKKK